MSDTPELPTEPQTGRTGAAHVSAPGGEPIYDSTSIRVLEGLEAVRVERGGHVVRERAEHALTARAGGRPAVMVMDPSDVERAIDRALAEPAGGR